MQRGSVRLHPKQLPHRWPLHLAAASATLPWLWPPGHFVSKNHAKDFKFRKRSNTICWKISPASCIKPPFLWNYNHPITLSSLRKSVHFLQNKHGHAPFGLDIFPWLSFGLCFRLRLGFGLKGLVGPHLQVPHAEKPSLPI